MVIVALLLWYMIERYFSMRCTFLMKESQRKMKLVFDPPSHIRSSFVFLMVRNEVRNYAKIFATSLARNVFGGTLRTPQSLFSLLV